MTSHSAHFSHEYYLYERSGADHQLATRGVDGTVRLHSVPMGETYWIGCDSSCI